jgi:6-phosphogluconolactonase (cycloisomerase 2 family)
MNASDSRIAARIGALSLLSLAACGGGGGGGSSAPPAAQGTNLGYVVNRGDSTISILNQDSQSGAMSQIGYMPMPIGQAGPERMVVHPNGKFAYVPNQDSSSLAVFTVQPSTGWLTPGISMALGAGPHDVAIDPSGKFLYATSQNSNRIDAFSIDPVTVALAFVQMLPTGEQPSACAVDRRSQFLFVALHGIAGDGTNSAIQTYDIDAATGTLSASQPALALARYQPTDIVVDPLRDHIYTTSEKFHYVIPMAYDHTTGALTARQARVAGGVPAALAIDHGGRFVYSANQDSGTLSCFVVSDLAMGVITNGPTNVACGANPTAVSFDPAGKHLYVLSAGGQTATQFAVDVLTGIATAAESVATRPTPNGIAFSSSPPPLHLVPHFVHVVAAGSDEAPAYAITPSTGALTELPSPAGTNQRPIAAATDPLHRFLFVASQNSKTIEGFTIDQATGALASIGGASPTIGVPTHVVVEPSGRFLYITTRDAVQPNDGWVTTWAIDPNDGSTVALDTHQIPDTDAAYPLNGAVWTSVDPTGCFLYVVTKSTVAAGNKVWLFAIDPANGSLTPSANAPLRIPSVAALGYHPKLRALYTVLSGANSVVTCNADPATGELTVVPGAAGNSGVGPSAIAVAPNGKFGYVSYLDPAGTGHVSAFSVNPTNGKLVVPSTTYTDGLHPIDLAMDGTGKFLYVANNGSNDVSMFVADPSTGVLEVRAATPSGIEPTAIVVTTLRQ